MESDRDKGFFLLDCTLRDGGYYTKWDFENNLVKDYCLAMESIPVDYVEIGYRSVKLNGYLGEFFYCPSYLIQRLKAWMPTKKLVVILNEKDTTVEDLDKLLDPCKRHISMVRVAIAPDRFDNAIELAKGIKGKGFEVGFNVMYMSTWPSNNEFLKKISNINGLVDYFYMVDSYGGILPEDVKEITKLVRSETDSRIGFHGHDNLHMGLINSITALESGCEIIDTTVSGMGRGAGNLKTELFLTYLSAKMGFDVPLDRLSEVVGDFERLQAFHQWGSNLPYMISGAYSLPQKDVMDWISKRRYSISGIVNALQEQVGGNGEIAFPPLVKDEAFSRAIIIGGGNGAVRNFEAIKLFIDSVDRVEDICIIHTSTRHAKFYSEFKVRQFFCLVGNEGYRLQKVFDADTIFSHTCVLPSNRTMGSFVPKRVVENTYEIPHSMFNEKHRDSPLAIAIEICYLFEINNIDFIGFDGYDSSTNRSVFAIARENQYLFDNLSKSDVNFSSLTETKYKINQSSLYGEIS
ncbi:aldolase catalytic domain-containing protein [Akkermansiaceae bacterium]|nr:aldolase catalytic domain-containing protein [Akkermansiaceae bacterium]